MVQHGIVCEDEDFFGIPIVIVTGQGVCNGLGIETH